LDVGIEAFGCCETHGGWRLSFSGDDFASVHYCLSGEGAMRVGKGQVAPLRSDTLVLIPASIPYRFQAGPDIRHEVDGDRLSTPSGDGLQHFLAGSGGTDPLIVACGRIGLSCVNRRCLFESLKTPIVEADIEPPLARQTFEKLLREFSSPAIGSRPLAEALLKQCLILLLRRQVRRGVSVLPWLAAFADKGLARALKTMIDDPGRPHGVDELARLAAMSRSVFLRRFAETFDRTPMDLLRDLRLARAAWLLRSTDQPVGRVSGAVGFGSRSHFSRVFKEKLGQDPTAYRVSGTEAA
jgi:AraC-like DNA-binding protein